MYITQKADKKAKSERDEVSDPIGVNLHLPNPKSILKSSTGGVPGTSGSSGSVTTSSKLSPSSMSQAPSGSAPSNMTSQTFPPMTTPSSTSIESPDCPGSTNISFCVSTNPSQQETSIGTPQSPGISTSGATQSYPVIPLTLMTSAQPSVTPNSDAPRNSTSISLPISTPAEAVSTMDQGHPILSRGSIAGIVIASLITFSIGLIFILKRRWVRDHIFPKGYPSQLYSIPAFGRESDTQSARMSHNQRSPDMAEILSAPNTISLSRDFESSRFQEDYSGVTSRSRHSQESEREGNSPSIGSTRSEISIPQEDEMVIQARRKAKGKERAIYDSDIDSVQTRSQSSR